MRQQSFLFSLHIPYAFDVPVPVGILPQGLVRTNCQMVKKFEDILLISILHRVQKKGATDFLAVTFANIDGFS